jgi:hypothetical protein
VASLTQIQAAHDRHRERMAEMMERRQSPVIADVAAKSGRVVFASRLAPMLSAELTPEAIRDLEKRPDVLVIDLDVPITSLIEEGTETIRAHEVWRDGLEGDSGTTVAVVESGTVYPSSAYLTVDAYYDTSPCSYAECTSQHDHATGVAAVIAKSDVSGAWQGVAPGGRLINGNAGKNASVNDMMNAADWAVSTQGALDVSLDALTYFYNPGLTANGGTVYFNSTSRLGAGDFHLGAGSPATDAGVAVPMAGEDAEGNARPDCVAWDIGAYEAQTGATSCFQNFLPAVFKGLWP